MEQPAGRSSDSNAPSFFAAYGSLRRHLLARRSHDVAKNLRFRTKGLLSGRGFIQNGYPGVIEQPGTVMVDIYEVLDDSIWEQLDAYEGFKHALGVKALFYRKEIRLIRPLIRAQVFFLGWSIPRGREPIERVHRMKGINAGYKRRTLSRFSRQERIYPRPTLKKGSDSNRLDPFRAP